MRSSTQSLTSYPQPAVLGEGGITAMAPVGLQALERVEAGAAGGAGQGGRSRVTQGSLGPEPVLGVGEKPGQEGVHQEEPNASCECFSSETLGQL